MSLSRILAAQKCITMKDKSNINVKDLKDRTFTRISDLEKDCITPDVWVRTSIFISLKFGIGTSISSICVCFYSSLGFASYIYFYLRIICIILTLLRFNFWFALQIWPCTYVYAFCLTKCCWFKSHIGHHCDPQIVVLSLGVKSSATHNIIFLERELFFHKKKL